jgi:hypothetical protein
MCGCSMLNERGEASGEGPQNLWPRLVNYLFCFHVVALLHMTHLHGKGRDVIDLSSVCSSGVGWHSLISTYSSYFPVPKGPTPHRKRHVRPHRRES